MLGFMTTKSMKHLSLPVPARETQDISKGHHFLHVSECSWEIHLETWKPIRRPGPFHIKLKNQHHLQLMGTFISVLCKSLLWVFPVSISVPCNRHTRGNSAAHARTEVGWFISVDSHEKKAWHSLSWNSPGFLQTNWGGGFFLRTKAWPFHPKTCGTRCSLAISRSEGMSD